MGRCLDEYFDGYFYRKEFKCMIAAHIPFLLFMPYVHDKRHYVTLHNGLIQQQQGMKASTYPHSYYIPTRAGQRLGRLATTY